MKRWRFLLLGAGIASLLAGCGPAASSGTSALNKGEQKKDEVSLTVEQQTGVVQIETANLTNAAQLLTAPGKIALTDTGSWHIGTLTSGRVEQVSVGLGDLVHQGQVLARIHSHEVHEARAAYQTAMSDLSRAQAAAASAKRNYERAQRLLDVKAGSVTDVERARQEIANADAAVRDEEINVEKERVHLRDGLGVPVDSGPEGHDDAADLIPIRAAGTGSILLKNVTPGSVADPTKDLFVIGDLRRLWMIASVNETSIAQLRLGQRATVTVKAFPEQHFSGKVTNLGEEFDPVTRVMHVRIDLENPSLRLRPEMLATVQIETRSSTPLLLIPSDAVQQVNEQDVVFVRKSDERFEVRPVRLGDSIDGRVSVLEGLKPGEAVVTRGSFLLKSQLLKSSLEGD